MLSSLNLSGLSSSSGTSALFAGFEGIFSSLTGYQTLVTTPLAGAKRSQTLVLRDQLARCVENGQKSFSFTTSGNDFSFEMQTLTTEETLPATLRFGHMDAELQFADDELLETSEAYLEVEVLREACDSLPDTKCISIVFDLVEEYIAGGNFAGLDKVLAKVEPENLKASVVLALVRDTFEVAYALPSWTDLLNRSREALAAKQLPADRLLGGLG